AAEASAAATVTATAATEAAATAAAAAEAAATATAAEATAAPGPVLGLVHAQGTPTKQSTVELRDGRLGRLIGTHRDERKAARAPRLPIHDEVHIAHLAHSLERRTHVVRRRAKRQVPHIQSLTHIALSLPAP